MYQNFNVYDNSISVFGKSFISPLSPSAKLYYKMYLLDSALIDNQWCYKIRFMPRRKQEPTFLGDMWIHDTTFAVKEVDAQIAEDANINFVQYLEIKQEYDQVENEVWMLTKDELFADFYLYEKQPGFYGRKSSSYKDFVINDEKPDEFYTAGQKVIVAEDANYKGDEYWHNARHDTLTDKEKQIYHLIDTLQEVPRVQTYIGLIYMLATGYKEMGKIELGSIYNIYSFNQVEGSRVALGFRTSNKFSTRIEFSAHGAYGFKDVTFKGDAGMRYMVSKQPRQVLRLNYKHDVEQLGQRQDVLGDDNIVSSVFRRTPNFKLTMVENIGGSYDHEWFPGFNSRVGFGWTRMRPLGELSYMRFDNNGVKYDVNRITTSEVSYYTRFAYNEKFVSGEFDRISLGTKFPVLEAHYAYGIPKLFHSDYEYHKLVLSLKHWFPIGILGWISYRVQAGKYWGTLPYPLLELHDGNETYYYRRLTFNTMNFFEFVSDEYATLFVTHHFDGLLFNRIPLFRKLKWREVASFNAAIGRFNDKHRSELALLPNMYTLDQPFMEAAIGIENIFTFLRVDFIKRLNYLDHPNIVNWGIRAMFDVNF